MACLLTHGRAESCKEFVGGIKAIYFLNYGVVGPQPTANYGSADLTDQLNTLTLTPSASTLFKYELKGANSFEQTITSSRENGTTFVEQTLTFTIKGLDATTTKQMKLLAWGRPHVIIQTNANFFFIAGLENGMDVTTGLVANGTAMGDLNGYTLTLVGQEAIPANHLNVAAPYGDTQIKAVTGATSIILAS
ncbi:MAG: hypothetical protein EBR41_00440 [Crocinitomicaceae bacterium]|nr:hypothetical protein [Crocinitomicaceae bacterium]